MNEPDKDAGMGALGAVCLFAFFTWLLSGNADAVREIFDQSTLYMKMGGSYVLGLAAVAVLFTVIGFAVSAGWRLGKRLEKEEG